MIILRPWGDLMVSKFVSGSRGLGSSLDRGHCVVFLGEDTLLSQCLSPPRAGLIKLTQDLREL